MWSSEKKDWCCAHFHQACDRFDCDYQLSSLTFGKGSVKGLQGEHKDLWTTEKQKWCLGGIQSQTASCLFAFREEARARKGALGSGTR